MRELGEEDIGPLDGSPSDHRRKRALENSVADEAASNQQEAAMPVKKRRVKNMQVDEHPELGNSDLAQWNSQYAENMALAVKLKENNKLASIAKKNAAFCVLGVGIAAVGLGLGLSRVPHPLDIFSGNRLLNALTGTKTGSPGRKRSHNAASDESDLDEFGRNVRQKNGGGEVGRGASVDHDGTQLFNVSSTDLPIPF